jgi:hypothetical protein
MLDFDVTASKNIVSSDKPTGFSLGNRKPVQEQPEFEPAHIPMTFLS